MEKLEQYRQYIQNILTKHSKYKPQREEIENECVSEARICCYEY